MKQFALALCSLGFALSAAAADSSSDAGLAEVRELGRLNGQALACSYTPVASRLKAIMIQHAPKSRRYGEAFETATNQAFLAQTKSNQAVCEDATTFSRQAEVLAMRLQAVIPSAPPR